MSTQAFPSTPYYPRLTLSLVFFFPSLPYPWYAPTLVWTEIATYMLPPKPHPLVYLERTLFHQPVVDFSFGTPEYFLSRIFVSKAIWRCNLVMILGQQPRYQCVPSSITMWQLFHREPSVLSWHHKLLTRQLLPTYTPWRRWGHRPQSKGSIAREDSNNKGSLHNKGQGIQIQWWIWFKDIQVFCWDIHN